MCKHTFAGINLLVNLGQVLEAEHTLPILNNACQDGLGWRILSDPENDLGAAQNRYGEALNTPAMGFEARTCGEVLPAPEIHVADTAAAETNRRMLSRPRRRSLLVVFLWMYSALLLKNKGHTNPASWG